MRKVALVALALVPTAAFGCTALLGDFELGAGSGTTTEAGSDGTTSGDGDTDGGTITDGGDLDAFDAQSLVFTTCGINESSIRTIEEITPDSGQSGYSGQVQIFRINQSTVRVIAQKADQNDGATVYSFDPKNGSGPLSPTVIDLQNAGRWLDARRLPNQGIISLLFLGRFAGAPLVHMKVIELPDTNLTAQQPINLSQDFPDRTAGMGSNVTGVLGAYQNNNEYFWALGGWPGTSANTWELLVGYRPSAQSIPAPVLVHSTSDDRAVRFGEMARSQQTQYLFNDKGPESQTDIGSEYFAIPQATTTQVAPKALRPVAGTKPFVMLAASGITTGDGIRLAAAEVDFSAATFGMVRAGVVSQADLMAGFDGTKVPIAFTISTFTEVPAESRGRFFGADMLWLGTPPEPLRGQGLNFIWYDTERRVMRAKQAGMQRMLQNHPAIEKSAIWLEQQTAVNADADVVFVERMTGNKWALQYARLSCIR